MVHTTSPMHKQRYIVNTFPKKFSPAEITVFRSLYELTVPKSLVHKGNKLIPLSIWTSFSFVHWTSEKQVSEKTSIAKMSPSFTSYTAHTVSIHLRWILQALQFSLFLLNTNYTSGISLMKQWSVVTHWYTILEETKKIWQIFNRQT